MGQVFRLAAEGLGTKAIQTSLYRKGIPSPTGKEVWHRPVLKRMVMSDTYKPHTREEAAEVVPPAVVASGVLKEDEEYGIRWWNRYSRRSRQVSEPARDGSRRYRRKVALSERDRAEWVATWVPALLPRGLVEAARSALAAPRPQERKNLTRGWELRGLMRCPSCGGAMTPHTAKRDEKRYHYYRCHRGAEYRRGSCKQRMKRAKEAEEAMWGFVSRIMKDPGRILVGMDALIEQKHSEMRGDLNGRRRRGSRGSLRWTRSGAATLGSPQRGA